MSFLILSLPRSRSAWLAHYLSYPLARPPQPVGHEILTECPTVETFLESYRHGMWGTVETGGAMLWPIVRNELPDCRIILVRRPLLDVYRSLAAQDVTPDLSALAEIDQHLNEAAVAEGVISVPYDLLSDPMMGQWLFEYCLELAWDPGWWKHMVDTNIQVDMPAWLRRIESERAQKIYKSLLEDVAARIKPTLH